MKTIIPKIKKKRASRRRPAFVVVCPECEGETCPGRSVGGVCPKNKTYRQGFEEGSKQGAVVTRRAISVRLISRALKMFQEGDCDVEAGNLRDLALEIERGECESAPVGPIGDWDKTAEALVETEAKGQFSQCKCGQPSMIRKHSCPYQQGTHDNNSPYCFCCVNCQNQCKYATGI